jgi:PAS domain S-box-containing protein
MQIPGPHPNEHERLESLVALDIGDAPPDPELSALVRIAARTFDVPMAAVGVVEERRVVFTNGSGLEFLEVPRNESFCGHTILGSDVFVVEDATRDERFVDNPLVVGERRLRFYAGLPLCSSSGFPFGTFFVMSQRPRRMNDAERETLRDFGLVVQKAIVRREPLTAGKRNRVDVHARLTAVLGSMAEAVIFLNAQGQIVSTNPVADELPEYVLSLLTEISQRNTTTLAFDETGRAIELQSLPHRQALATGQSQHRRILGIREKSIGVTRWYEISCEAITSGSKVVGVACSLLDVTSHQQLVLGLQNSEHRMQAMAANVPGVIYQLRTYPDGCIEYPYISQGIERVYGITPDVWRANPEWPFQAIVDDDKDGYASSFAAAQASQTRFDWEGRTTTGRPSEVIWIHCQSLPTSEPGGSVLWNGVISDTTVSKRQAEALRISEERFRIVTEQTHQMIYDIDVQTGETVWAGATLALLGRTPEEMRELSLAGWMDLIHPDDRDSAAIEVDRSVALEHSFSVRYRFRKRDGTYIWAHDRGTYVRNNRGKPIRMLGAISDVTAEVNALRQSEESQSRAEALIAAIPDTVIRVTAEGRVVDVRHLQEWPYGSLVQETNVKTLDELMPQPIVSTCLEHVCQVVGRGGGEERFELVIDKDGRKNDFEVRASTSGSNEAVMVMRDVTEQRAVECLKSQFVSTVSHELRTPLASIRGALGLMTAGIAGELSSMTKELSELALDNTKRLERLINDLLDLESSDSGQLRLTVGAFDLRPLLEKTLRQVTPFATTLGVGLGFESKVQVAECQVDADRFVQVVSNLLSNAIKHSRSGNDVVLRLESAGEWWRVEVQNTGNPIPESFRSRIFHRFAMADASDSRARGGTGLGLAIAKALVERMGGRIDYISEVDTTRFFVELPQSRGALSNSPLLTRVG